MDHIVTRFAPSPTGKLHSGAYRTAIFAYLFARKHAGTFILRIEDTDKERSTKENEENILDSLAWLGLEYDKKYVQSENMERHKEILLKMIEDGHAYVSKEEAKDGSGVIKEIVRFKNPNTDVTFHDEIKGDVTMHTADLGDFVLAKNINEPLFHLAVVVDDFDEGVTHVIRGEDHVSNTPRQILIQRAIGAPTPVYAHLPLVLGEDRQKLSKRKGALAITDYRDRGFLPGAILNMVCMVGWNPGTDQELFSKDELIQTFDLTKVQKSPAVFNPEKLNWYNREYIKMLDIKQQTSFVFEFLSEKMRAHPRATIDYVEKLTPIILDHVSTFGEITTLSEAGEWDYFFDAPVYNEAMLVSPKTKLGSGALITVKDHIANVFKIIQGIPDDAWDIENIKGKIMTYAEQNGKGDVLWAFRVFLTGKEKSPDPFTVTYLLGKEEILKRI